MIRFDTESGAWVPSVIQINLKSDLRVLRILEMDLEDVSDFG